MHIVFVHIHVKPEHLADFIEATKDNASHSVEEPGIARFDFIQNKDDPNRFVLVEVYRTEGDVARHKETAHYNRWRERVEAMMVEPRQGVKYSNILPEDAGW